MPYNLAIVYIENEPVVFNPLGPHVADLLQKFVHPGIGVSVYHLM